MERTLIQILKNKNLGVKLEITSVFPSLVYIMFRRNRFWKTYDEFII